MPIFDRFGRWDSVGSVIVSFNWQFFPLFPSTPNSLYRAFYTLNRTSEYFRAIPPLHFRSSFFSGTEYFYSQKWVKAWAKDAPEVLELPYPADLVVNPLPQRQIQVKFAHNHQHRIYPNGITLSVQLFEKTSSFVVHPSGPVPEEVPEGENSTP